MKVMKKITSIFLVTILLAAFSSLACGAQDLSAQAEDDIVRFIRWESDSLDATGFGVVLHPRYVKSADSIPVGGNYDFHALSEDDCIVQRKVIQGFGECFVIYCKYHLSWNACIFADSFFDEDGNGNPYITLLMDQTENAAQNPVLPADGGQLISVTKYYNHNVHGSADVAPGGRAMISFALSGTVSCDGIVLEENTDSFNLDLSTPGEHRLVLTVNDFFTSTYEICVKPEDQIRKERIAELKEQLGEDTKNFFHVLPISLATTLLFPIAFPFLMIWPFSIALPAMPFSYAVSSVSIVFDIIRLYLHL